MNLGQENEFVEFKKTTSEIKEGMVSIAAILNKHGRGELYFGVGNGGEVLGQDVSETTLRQLGQTIATSIKPAIYPTIEALEDGKRGYIRVAFSGFEAPYACKGKYYIRVADTDVQMSQEELSRMFLYARAREVPWDQWESSRPVADVDEAELRAYIARGNSCGRIRFSYAGAENALSRLALIRNGKLTNAAEVLFCPSRSVGLKMGIFANHARTEVLDMRQEHGTLFALVREAEHYILMNTRRRFVIRGSGPREEIPELPPEAVREVLYNAFTHRDHLSSASVQVEIYSDSVEITNPGWFIEGQDPAAHLSGEDNSSLSRNMLIAQTLHKSRDIESFGTGIPRIREACQSAGIVVEYTRTASGTKFTFHRNEAFEGEVPANSGNDPASSGNDPASSGNAPTSSGNAPTSSGNDPASSGNDLASSGNDPASSDKFRQVPTSSDNALASSGNLPGDAVEEGDLSDAEKLACALMSEKGEVRSPEVAAATGLTQRGAQKLLTRLVARGLAEAQGADRNRTYRLKKPAEFR